MSAFTFPRVHPTAAVLRELFAAGFSPISWGEAQIDVDGQIELTTAVHVQVGVDYFNVMKKHPDGTYTMYAERRSIPALVKDLRHALGKETK